MTTHIKRRLAAGIVAAWAFGCAAAAPLQPDSIDLPSAIRLALEGPRLRAAGHEAAASAAAIGQAGHYPNPTLEYLREGEQAGTRTTTVQLNQPIELGGKRRARVALAESTAALARGDLAALRQEVRAEVIAGWYAVLAAQERQQLATTLAGLAAKGIEVAERQVAAGKVSPIDATRARLAAVDASTELNAAQAELAIARTRLGALVGRPGEALVLAPGQDAAPPALKPLAALLADAAQALPVRRARGQLAAEEAQSQVERAARLPDLTLSVGSQKIDDVARRQAVVGVSLPLPLFNRNEGNLLAALRRSDKARDEVTAAETAAASDIGTAYTRYEQARSEAAMLRADVIPSAQSAYELTLKGFEHGKFAFLDVLDAQRTWARVQLRQWTATQEAWRAYADLARLNGAAIEQDRQERP
ncbi:MAG: TolC family protein [Pseudomonadota bacterium]